MYDIPRHRLYDRRWSGKKTRLANYHSNYTAFAKLEPNFSSLSEHKSWKELRLS